MRFRTLLGILFVCTVIVYCSSFFNPFIWDDEQFIYKNEYVVSFSISKIFTENTIAGAGLKSNYYRPLTTLSFASDHALWGLQPLGFHVTNTFLHALAALLCALVLYLLTKSRGVSFWLALLFAVHPLQTEAVTYINSRGDSLSAVFGLTSALLTYLFLDNKQYVWRLYNLRYEIPRSLLITAAILSYVCSILSKEIGIASLVLIGIIVFEHARTHSVNASTVKKYLVVFSFFVCAAACYLLLRATTLNFQNSFDFYQDGSLYSQSTSVRLMTFTRVLWTYWKLIFIPYPLHMERTQDVITTVLSPWPLPTAVFLTGVLSASIFVGYKKKNFLPLYGYVWFFGLLSPVSGIIPINGVLYEHWLYLPIVGFFLFLVGWFQLAQKFLLQDTWRRYSMYLLSCCAVVLSILTIRQNYLWADTIRFYEYTLQYSVSARLHNNLGMAYAEKHQYSKALNHYNQALQLGGENPVMYHNIGNTYGALGDTAAAITNYKKAIALNPQFFYSYLALYRAYLHEKRTTEAAQLLQEYTQRFPGSTSQ